MQQSDQTAQRLQTKLVAASMAGLLFSLIAGRARLWGSNGPELPGIVLAGIFTLGLIAGWKAIPRAFRTREWRGFGAPFLVSGLLLVFLSDWLNRPYNFLQGPAIRGEIALCGLAVYVLVRHKLAWMLYAVFPLAIFLVSWSFLDAANGRLLFSDDHPVFLYRLTNLRHNFPIIPFFNPLWNGGIDCRDFFATGSLNFFFFNFPWLYIFEPREIYNYLIAGTLFVLVPVCAYFAARYEELPRPAPAIAGILSITVGLIWFRWALSYGTMGFMTTVALMPLSLVMTAKLLSREEALSPKEAILFPILFTLMLFWSPSGIVFLPAAAIALFRIRALLKKRFFVLVAVAILALNLPWISLFWSVSNVGRFIKVEDSKEVAHVGGENQVEIRTGKTFRHRRGELNLGKSLVTFREGSISTNPLLIFAAIPALLAMRRRSRLLFTLTVVWLLALGTIFVPIKPQLELDRMLLLMYVCLAIPISGALASLLTSAGMEGAPPRAVAALAGGFLLAAPFSSASAVSNRTLAPVHFASSEVEDMAAAIETHGGEGRTMFAGFVLHELDEGHLAPLVFMQSKPLVASSFVHDKWAYEDIIPGPLLKEGDSGIKTFMDLYNITAVLAHESKWKQYFGARSNDFGRVASIGKFAMYERRGYDATYFLGGSGSFVRQTTNEFVVRPETDSVVLKLNYFPFLVASSCEISEWQGPAGIRLVRLDHCVPGAEVTIRADTPFSRVFGHGR